MSGDIEAEGAEPLNKVPVGPLNLHAERNQILPGDLVRMQDIGQGVGREFRIMAPPHEILNVEPD